MKTKLLALAVACAAVSFSANAAVDGTWSVGAAAGWAHAYDHNFQSFEKMENKNGYAFKLNGEYNFTDWFALGLGYDYLKGQKAAIGAFESGNTHTNVVDLYGRFAYPINNYGTDVFFKVGPTYNKTSAFGDSHSNWGALTGVGVQFALNDASAIRVGYDYNFNTTKLDSRERLDNGQLYVGYQYTFGAPKAPIAPVAAPAPVAKKTVRVTENHTLDAGILFPFDGSTLSAEGKKAVADVVASSTQLQNTEYEVYGYTDRIGSDAYNNKLSQKRADAVSAELQNNGVTTLKASEGKGKSSPVTGNKCDAVKGRQAVIDCLAADRRVEVLVTGDTTQVQEQQ
jgi:OmpA-OmpF porin, OOP family